MSAGCGMCHLRFRLRLGVRLRFERGLGLGIGGGLRVAPGPGLGVRAGFRRGLAGFGFILGFVNRPDHVERAFRVVLEFIAQDPLAAIERGFEAEWISWSSANTSSIGAR